MKINVLVTDSTYKHSLGIVRALGKEGIKPYILSNRAGALCSLSKYAKKELILPIKYTLEELIKISKENNIELIILVGTNSFKKIVPWKTQLKAEGIEVVTPDESTQNIALSKPRTYELAHNIGVPTPITIYPKSFNELNDIKENIKYPCVIKGLYEVGANIVDYAHNKNELITKYKILCDKNNITEKDGLPMLQEYISGQGCAFFAVFNKGKCGPTFQHKRIREYPVTGGASVCAESERNPALEKYGRALLEALNWHGVAMVEFKLNSNGDPILMEINPKFWGSTDLALEAGVNFPLELIKIYKNLNIEYSNNYKFPFKYHWPLDGDLQHGLEKPSNIFAILIDCLSLKVKSNIWLSDFKPTWAMLLGFAKLIVKQFIWR